MTKNEILSQGSMITKILRKIFGPAWLFMSIALVFGVSYALLTPSLWGLDETSHFARVYQLAHGEILPHADPKSGYGGMLPKSLVDLGSYAIGDLVDNKNDNIAVRKDVDHPDQYRLRNMKPFSKEMQASPSTSSYTPIAYVGPVIGVIAADALHLHIGHTIFLARLFSLLLYIAIVSISLILLRESRIKWVVFAVALLPESLYQASVVSADSMATGLSLLFIALFIRLTQDTAERIDKQLLYWLIAVSLLIPLVKINYIFLSLCIIFIPKRIFKSAKTAIAAKVGSIAGMGVFVFIWGTLTKVTGETPASQRPDGIKLVPGDQILYVLHQPLNFLAACIRSLTINADAYFQSLTSLIGWNYVSMPTIFILLVWLGILLATMNTKSELLNMRKTLIWTNIILLVGCVSIFGALYVAFTPTAARVVDGVQGRYFIPFLVPILMLLASVAPIDLRIKDNVAPYIYGTISTVCLAISAIYYYLATY